MQEVYLQGIILAVGSAGLPLLTPLLQVLPPPALSGLNANLVISINDQSSVLITPSFHLVVAIYQVPATERALKNLLNFAATESALCKQIQMYFWKGWEDYYRPENESVILISHKRQGREEGV